VKTAHRTTLPALLLCSAALACATSSGRPAAAPTDAGAGPRAAEIAPAADGERSARAQRLFEEAVKAQEDQRKLAVPTDWAHLERKWRAAVDAGGGPEARFNLGVTLEAQGKLADARAEYEAAAAAKPSLRQAGVNLAVLLEKEGDVRGASAAYARIVRDFPEDALARERLASLYRHAGQNEEAWRLAREALLRDPASVGAYKVLARVALQRNELDLAKLIALRAEKLDARDPELPFIAGEVLAKQGDQGGAAAQYRRAIALRADFLPARYALLESATRGEAWGAVAEHAQAILRKESANAAVHLTLGIAQRHLGKPDEALASYAQAEKVAGGSLPEVHLARGVLYMRVKNECEPAVASFRAFGKAAGPMVAADSDAPKLERECLQILEENRRAAEAAKQMQHDAERKAAEGAAAKTIATPPAAQGADGGAAPTPPQRPSR
jgi:tetratricopeptide (TPR) repeat protein